MFNVNSNLGGKYMDSFGNDQDNEPLLPIFFYFCTNNAKNSFNLWFRAPQPPGPLTEALEVNGPLQI